MAVEFGGGSVFDKRNRWIVTTFMALAALAFAGISVLPLLGAFQNNPQVASSPAAAQDRLEIEAKGYELVLQREPENQAALKGLLEVRIEQNNLQAVVPVLEQLATQNSEQPDYTILLAQTKERVGDREGAAQAYRSVLETRPADINALKGLAELLIQENRPEVAIGLLQDTLRTADETNRVQPGSVNVISVQVLLGEVYFKQERYDEAIATYDTAIQAAPQDFRPILGKALAVQAQGNNEDAAPLFASAEALAPDQYKDQIKELATAPASTTTPETPAVSLPDAAPDGESSENEAPIDPDANSSDAAQPEADVPAATN